MSDKSLSALIGNIKRNYPKNDFNPYSTMDFVYDHCLSMGSGSKVLVIGYSKRFEESIIPAMHHVMASRGILKKEPIPYPIAGEVVSHTGAIIRFANIKDMQVEQQTMIRELSEASIAVLCNPYKNAVMRQILRHKSPGMSIYDTSQNNSK